MMIRYDLLYYQCRISITLRRFLYPLPFYAQLVRISKTRCGMGSRYYASHPPHVKSPKKSHLTCIFNIIQRNLISRIHSHNPHLQHLIPVPCSPITIYQIHLPNTIPTIPTSTSLTFTTKTVRARLPQQAGDLYTKCLGIIPSAMTME